MVNTIAKNVQHLLSGVIQVDKLPDALRCISIGSRNFVRAVRAFQEAYGLLVDGECGPITMGFIEEQNKPKPVKKKKKQKSAPESESIGVDLEE